MVNNSAAVLDYLHGDGDATILRESPFVEVATAREWGATATDLIGREGKYHRGPSDQLKQQNLQQSVEASLPQSGRVQRSLKTAAGDTLSCMQSENLYYCTDN